MYAAHLQVCQILVKLLLLFQTLYMWPYASAMLDESSQVKVIYLDTSLNILYSVGLKIFV